jgi:CMP-N-acetylneuraminic acid synthetase
MILFKSFNSNHRYGHGDNHEDVIEKLNAFLETFEENGLAYIDDTTHFLENECVLIELKYRKLPPTREVLFEKAGS